MIKCVKLRILKSGYLYVRFLNPKIGIFYPKKCNFTKITEHMHYFDAGIISLHAQPLIKLKKCNLTI